MDASALRLKSRRNVLELQLDGFDALEPGDDGRSWTSISRGAKEGNARPWGCARPRAAMSWPLEVLPRSSSSF